MTSIFKVERRLQSSKINFNEAQADIENREKYISRMRDSLCENAIMKGKGKCAEYGIDVYQQWNVRRRKKRRGRKHKMSL